MTDHSVRTWAKADGTWDVTHHREKGDGHLYDVERDFKNFPTRDLAEHYAFLLFKRLFFKGNHVELKSPDGFGQETSSGGCWGAFEGDSWMVRLWANGKLFFWSSPANANDQSKVPMWILAELKKLKLKNRPSFSVNLG